MATSNLIALSLVVYLLSYSPSSAQNLTAELCAAKLTTGRSEMGSLYDGNDTVYLFGGISNGVAPRSILKYSISQDTIEPAGQLPFAYAYNGQAVTDKLNNIYYFNPMFDQNIYQYFPANGSLEYVAPFDDGIRINEDVALIKPDNDTALIFNGGSQLIVTSLNLNTLESVNLGNVFGARSSLEAVWMKERETAYIFTSGNILKYYPADNRVEALGKRVDLIDRNAVTDGNYIYLLGRLLGNATGIFVFSPENEDSMYVEVEKKPNLAEASVFYVEKLNRIYIFGGYVPYEEVDLDDIYYISLDPINGRSTTTP